MMGARQRLAEATSTPREGGFTLVEALISMTIFVTVLSLMGSVVAAMTKNMRQAEGVSIAAEQNRLAFQRLDKQVRYAQGIKPPGVASDGSLYFELMLEGAEDGSPGNDKRNTCHQWRYIPPSGATSGQLQVRSWRVNVAPSAGYSNPKDFVTVATGLTNTASERPFTYVEDVAALHQGIVVDLQTTRSTSPPGSAHLKGTFYARNTTTTFPATDNYVCYQRGRTS